MKSQARPGLYARCRTAAPPACIGAAAAAIVALSFLAVLVLGDAINNVTTALGQSKSKPTTKLSPGAIGILPAAGVRDAPMAIDKQKLGFEEAASQARSESGPGPEPVYATTVANEGGIEDEGIFRRNDGGTSQGHRERSLRGVVTRPVGSARCFFPADGGPSRCHPNMFYVGVSKCGTTSFANWLEGHPQLKWVTIPHEYNWGKPSVPPMATELDPVMDYTAHYSIMEEIPYRILDAYGREASDGTVKILVSVREPASRTISSWEYKYNMEEVPPEFQKPHYEHGLLKQRWEEGKEQIASLIDCRSRHLEEDPSLARFREVDLEMCKPADFFPSRLIAHVGKSVYYLQLERWIKVFGRENVKVLFLEEVSADPVGALQSAFTFLGIDPALSVDWGGITSRKHNLTGSKKKDVLGVQVTPELEQEMRDYYEPHNLKLQELLGRPLPPNWSLPAN